MLDEMRQAFEALLQLEQGAPDFRIQKGEFEQLLAQNNGGAVVRTLTGAPNLNRWTTFRDRFVGKQAELGIHWAPSVGFGGPLQLERVALPARLGSELAKAAHENGIEEGNLQQVIRRFVPEYGEYFDKDRSTDIVEFDFTTVRESFKNTTVGKNESYRFNVGRGHSFSRTTQVYRFGKKNERKSERRLGELATPIVREWLGLDALIHTQEERAFRALENLDMVGAQIRRGPIEDDLDVYAFEMKPTNDVGDVLKALAQAVSYKRYSNYSYIVVPQLHRDSFPDQERYEEIVAMGRENEVGIISLVMTHADGNHGDEPRDVEVIYQPTRSEIETRSYLDMVMSREEWIACPLCRRIVGNTTADGSNCGWLASDNQTDETICMRKLQEENATELRRFISQSLAGE